jgi:Xaa-Pro aminopeptidase
MSETQPELPNRQTPFSDAFKTFIAEGWAPYPTELPARLPASEAAVARRERVSAMFPGQRLVIPAGGLKVRSNDTDFRFRPHSAFAHLTGLGTDREPDAVLVLEPTDDGHDATLYFTPRAPRDSAEFYSDARYGEMWVGRRPSLEELAALCGVRCVPVAELPEHLAKNAEETLIRVVREADPALAAQLDQVREATEEETLKSQDAELAEALSELRLIKDDFEIDQMRQACAETAEAFEAVVRDLPEAVRRGRGERWVEGIFGLHARHVGNAVGYDTIAASGDHACTLHWIRNDGDLREGDLLLLDAGIELDTLYTADVTRTLPVNGRFTDDQRQVYEAVLEAQQAGIDAAKPGAKFADVHKAAIAVLARKLEEWGLLPVSAVRRWRPAPALDGARHVPPPRHRRARLRAGPPGEVPRGHPGPGHDHHRRAGAVLQVRRRAGARETARHRRPDRGRRRDHRRRR